MLNLNKVSSSFWFETVQFDNYNWCLSLDVVLILASAFIPVYLIYCRHPTDMQQLSPLEGA